MSKPVKRYDNGLEYSDGKWVRYSDHERAMAEKEAELKEYADAYTQLDEDNAEHIAEIAGKDAELKTAREYLAHMHNTEECLAKAIAENEELTVTVASLKARCEGMRKAVEKFIREYVVCPDDPAVVCPTLEEARMEMKSALASLPVEGLAERVARELFAYVVGDDIDRTSPSLRDEYMTEAAKIIRLIGGTR